MNVKGAAYIGRVRSVIDQFGQEKWDQFMNEFCKKEPYFKNPIIATTSIPMQTFLLFADEVLKHFYNNDDKLYFKLGEASAKWALTEGPYKAFMIKNDVKKFVEECAPTIWILYYDEGSFQTKMDGDIVTIQIKCPIKHVYFEYIALGYLEGGMKICGVKEISKERIKGFSAGDDEISYKFTILKK